MDEEIQVQLVETDAVDRVVIEDAAGKELIAGN
jgi:hypothetical protein